MLWVTQQCKGKVDWQQASGPPSIAGSRLCSPYCSLCLPFFPPETSTVGKGLNLYRIYIVPSFSSLNTTSHSSVFTTPWPHFPIPYVLTLNIRAPYSFQKSSAIPLCLYTRCFLDPEFSFLLSPAGKLLFILQSPPQIVPSNNALPDASLFFQERTDHPLMC